MGAQSIIIPSGGGANADLIAPVFRSGRFYPQWHNGLFISRTVNAAPFSTSQALLCPFYVGPKEVTFDGAQIEVTTGASSQSCAISIFSLNTLTGVPQTRLVASGVLDCSSTGVQTLTFADTVCSGWIFIWMAVTDAAIAFRCIDDSDEDSAIVVSSWTGMAGTPADSSESHFYFQSTFSLGSFGAENDAPADTESTIAGTDGENFPVVYLRVA